MAETKRPGWSRRTKIIIASVVAVVVLAAGAVIAMPYIYAGLIAAEAPDAPTISQADDDDDDGGSGEALDPAQYAGTWEIVDGYAGYRVDEVLQGQNVTVVGRTEQVSGSFTLEGSQLSEGSVVVDIASIETDNSNRDDYFRDDAMQADEYPTAEFALIDPIELPADATAGQVTTVTAVGEITIRDVTQEVTAELEVMFDGERAQVVGSVPVTFADYGVEAPSLGFVEVEPEGTIEFELSLAQS